MVMAEALRGPDMLHRRASATILADFCEESKLDLQEHAEQLLRMQLRAFADEDSEVVHAAWRGLDSIIKRIESDKQRHVQLIMSTVKYARAVPFASEAQPPLARALVLVAGPCDESGFCLPAGTCPSRRKVLWRAWPSHAASNPCCRCLAIASSTAMQRPRKPRLRDSVCLPARSSAWGLFPAVVEPMGWRPT